MAKQPKKLFYPKIPTIWTRDKANNYKTLVHGEFATPFLDYLQNTTWEMTEKVDGTNVSVHWDGEVVSFNGRSDRAQIPRHLLDYLLWNFAEVVPDLFDTEVRIFGEGFGHKVQGKEGAAYAGRLDGGIGFILFDVLIKNKYWLQREDLVGISEDLNCLVVPMVHIGTLWEAISLAERGFPSQLRDTPPEGLVCKPAVRLHDAQGRRIITKIKLKDFNR